MFIQIIGVGKLKEKYLTRSIAEYVKRLTPYLKFQIIEVADEKAPDSLSEAEVGMVKMREGERILAHYKALGEHTRKKDMILNLMFRSANIPSFAVQ